MVNKNQWVKLVGEILEEQDIYIVSKHLPKNSLLIRKETVIL